MRDIMSIIRGGSLKPLKLLNGKDWDDSVLDVTRINGNTTHFDHLATGPSQNLTIVSEGIVNQDEIPLHSFVAPGNIYAAIGAYNDTLGKHYRIFLRKYADDGTVKHSSDIRPEMTVLPATKPNPSASGAMTVSDVNLHIGGIKGSLSMACFTMYPEHRENENNWPEFLPLWEQDKIFDLNLSVADGYIYPES